METSVQLARAVGATREAKLMSARAVRAKVGARVGVAATHVGEVAVRVRTASARLERAAREPGRERVQAAGVALRTSTRANAISSGEKAARTSTAAGVRTRTKR